MKNKMLVSISPARIPLLPAIQISWLCCILPFRPVCLRQRKYLFYCPWLGFRYLRLCIFRQDAVCHGKRYVHPGSERNDGRIHGNRSSDCGACSGGCNSIRRMFTGFAAAFIWEVICRSRHIDYPFALGHDVRNFHLCAFDLGLGRLASVAEFDLAVSFDLETGVLWVFEVFLLSMLFLISAKEMFAVFTAETEARAPSVFAGILSLTRLDNFALSGDTQVELAKLCTWLAVFFCDWIENVVTGAGKQEGHQWSCSHDFQIQILFTKNWLAAAFDPLQNGRWFGG